MTNGSSSPYNIFITNKSRLIETFEFDFCDHVCGPFLRSCRSCWVQCGAPLVCTIHPLLLSPAPSSATHPKLLPWSLQDDQDVSLHTCHIWKQSRWEIYQLVNWTMPIFLIIKSTSAGMQSVETSHFWHFFND